MIDKQQHHLYAKSCTDLTQELEKLTQPEGPNIGDSPRKSSRYIPIRLPGKSSIDLSFYQKVVEIYRVALAPTALYLAQSNEHEKPVVIKKIFKADLHTPEMKKQAAQEFQLQCALNHENIVKGYSWDENDEEYLMTMESMNKADYFHDKIEVNLCPVKNEIKMKSYMSDILEALIYCHDRGIVHGDMKLENCLMQKFDDENLPIVKLCDFGFSRFLDQDGVFYAERLCGTAGYMAPEMKAKTYLNEKIDIWALGIILYKIAVAYKPTQIAGYKYGSGPIPFRKQDWKRRSPELQDLVTKLLEYDPKKRISAKEAIEHPWFQVA